MKYKKFRPMRFRTEKEKTGISESNPNKTAIMKWMDNGLTLQTLGQAMTENPFPGVVIRQVQKRRGVQKDRIGSVERKTWRLAEQLAKKDNFKYGGTADYFLKLYLGQTLFLVSRGLSPLDMAADYQKGTGTDLGPIIGLATGGGNIEDMLTAKKKKQIKRRRY